MHIAKAKGIDQDLLRLEGAKLNLTGGVYYSTGKPLVSTHSLLTNLWDCGVVRYFYKWVFYNTQRKFGGGWLFRW